MSESDPRAGSRSGTLLVGAGLTLTGVLTLIWGSSVTTWRGTPRAVARWIVVVCGVLLMHGSRTLKQK